MNSYNFSKIRALLTQGFSVEELHNFCFDTPAFRPVYDQLGAPMGKDQVVKYIVEYAERRHLVEPLLAWARKQNPAAFETHYLSTLSTATPESRPRRWNWWEIIAAVATVIGVIVAIIALVNGWEGGESATPSPGPGGSALTVRVVEQGSGKPVAGLDVFITVEGSSDFPKATTDNSGQARFANALPKEKNFVQVFIAADDYEAYDQGATIDKTSPLFEVQLKAAR